MNYRIISDTSCDINEELEKELRVLLVPFKIDIEGVENVDDKNLDINDFIEQMRKTQNPIKSACPSPFDYLEKLEECEENTLLIVTISSKLSGSHNSAMIAKTEFEKEHPNKKVYIIDSKSASAGQLSVLLQAHKIMEQDKSIEDKISEIENAVDRNHTFFILESLDNLVKNGRIKKTAGLIANALNIRPTMTSINGEIEIHEINRGFKKSLMKLAKELGTIVDDIEERILVISHVDALEKAQLLAEKAREVCKFKDVLIVHTKGLATGYADIGGIVVGV